MRPVRKSGGRSVREGFRREQSRRKTNGPSGPLEVTLQEGGIRADFSEQGRKADLRERSRSNNSNLAQHEIQVECCEMGTISNDCSHLCFI